MNIRGAYSLGVRTGVIAAGIAADGQILQWRWTDGTRVCIPRLIRVSGGGITAFTAGYGEFGIWILRSFTADGSGGTPITMTANDQKRSTSFPTTLAPSNSSIRVATTGVLASGTFVADTNAFVKQGFGVSAAAGQLLGYQDAPIWQFAPVPRQYDMDDSPWIIQQNEGFMVTAVMPATGTWTASITVDWLEATLVSGF